MNSLYSLHFTPIRVLEVAKRPNEKVRHGQEKKEKKRKAVLNHLNLKVLKVFSSELIDRAVDFHSDFFY